MAKNTRNTPKVAKVAKRYKAGEGPHAKRGYDKSNISVPAPDPADAKAINNLVNNMSTKGKELPTELIIKQHKDGTIVRADDDEA